MKQRITRSELRRTYSKVWMLRGDHTKLLWLLSDGERYMTQHEGWMCDVYAAGDAALTQGDAPVGKPLPAAFARQWESRAARVYASPFDGRFMRAKRLRAAFLRAVARLAD